MARNFKIRGPSRKVGVIADSYGQLIDKCREKFSLMENETIVFKLSDDTEVDEEYFDVLENNEELSITTSKSSSSLIVQLEKFLCNFIHRNIKDIDGKLQEIFHSKNDSDILTYLGSLAESNNGCQSFRKDHTSWFEGLNTKYITKEAVLRNSSESRIRGYFQKMKKDLACYEGQKLFKKLVHTLQEELKHKKYNAAYFDRTAEPQERLCSETGLFYCYGAYNKVDCQNKHFINPYDSREARILFSTWNFDHMIEKSRSIIPTLKEALDRSPQPDINFSYFSQLLFDHYCPSKKNFHGNLKLVHIVCHDKAPHQLECDKSKAFMINNEKEKVAVKCKPDLENPYKKLKLSS